jgi:hypothetical protein
MSCDHGNSCSPLPASLSHDPHPAFFQLLLKTKAESPTDPRVTQA